MVQGRPAPAGALGALLVAARARRGDNQRTAAAVFGVGQSTWSRWETGRETPHVARWRALAVYAGVTPAEVAAALLADVERSRRAVAAASRWSTVAAVRGPSPQSSR